jgi:hypothetical protein
MDDEEVIKPIFHISALIPTIPNAKGKVLYPRQELIKKFVDRINADRAAAGFKPLTARFIATKMYTAGLKDDFDLNWFFGYCNDAKTFGSCWWWALGKK